MPRKTHQLKPQSELHPSLAAIPALTNPYPSPSPDGLTPDPPHHYPPLYVNQPLPSSSSSSSSGQPQPSTFPPFPLDVPNIDPRLAPPSEIQEFSLPTYVFPDEDADADDDDDEEYSEENIKERPQHTPVTGPPYTCRFPDCGKTYQSTSSLWKHEDKHTREYRKCPRCESQFNVRYDLLRHWVRVHDADKNMMGEVNGVLEELSRPRMRPGEGWNARTDSK